MKNLFPLFLSLLLLSSFDKAYTQDFQKITNGVKTEVNGIYIEVQFMDTHIVRIVKYPVKDAYDKKSLVVILKPLPVNFKIFENGKTLWITGPYLKALVDLKGGNIGFYDSRDSLLLRENYVANQFTPVKDSLNNTFAVSQSFHLDSNEAIYGLGQHQMGVMNQRGQTITLKQDNREIGIPFLYSSKGYGLFWDNYSTTVFKDSAQGTTFTSQVGDAIDYYFIAGKRADSVISGMRRLTGAVPMFPRWAFGYWQSRERYKTQQQVIDVLKKYRELNIPIDGIVQDWQYWGTDSTQWNATVFGNPGYPDPKGLVDSVHKLHAHIIISVWPSFGSKTKIWAEMKSNGFLYDHFLTWPPTTAVQPYDAFNPDARALYWSYLNKNIFSIGMDGWWLDSTEPDHSNPKESDDNTATFLGTFRKVRNAYPLMTTGGVYQHQREVTDRKRVFILARSAFAGQQRNGTTIWSGDIGSDWRVFHNQISGGLNLSLCGIPYWNTDIGGFFAGAFVKGGGANNIGFQELYVRWLQFGVFCPIMRSHGTDIPREIYQFGKPGYWAFDAIARYINLRYRLLPYNYSNAWSVTEEASTMMRALVMDFPYDKKVLHINDEYMFGKAFLVTPVTDSMYTSRASGKTDFSVSKIINVYLPANHIWYDFWTGVYFNGGVTVKKETPIDVLPLYVKAGSIIPMGPFQQYTDQLAMKTLEVRIYKGEDGKFTLYEDENDNYDYEKGVYATIDFLWHDKERELVINNRKGSFPGMLKNRTFKLTLVDNHHGAGEEVSNPDVIVHYNGLKEVVKFKK
jgi:alpha-D-xyloside xylohydrolase